MNDIYLKEISKLVNLLVEAGVPFRFRPCWEGYQVIYEYDNGVRIADAVCHQGSYGHQEGLLEIMGLVNVDEILDDVEGWLTGEEVARRMINHWENRRVR